MRASLDGGSGGSGLDSELTVSSGLSHVCDASIGMSQHGHLMTVEYDKDSFSETTSMDGPRLNV